MSGDRATRSGAPAAPSAVRLTRGRLPSLRLSGGPEVDEHEPTNAELLAAANAVGNELGGRLDGLYDKLDSLHSGLSGRLEDLHAELERFRVEKFARLDKLEATVAHSHELLQRAPSEATGDDRTFVPNDKRLAPSPGARRVRGVRLARHTGHVQFHGQHPTEAKRFRERVWPVLWRSRRPRLTTDAWHLRATPMCMVAFKRSLDKAFRVQLQRRLLVARPLERQWDRIDETIAATRRTRA